MGALISLVILVNLFVAFVAVILAILEIFSAPIILIGALVASFVLTALIIILFFKLLNQL